MEDKIYEMKTISGLKSRNTKGSRKKKKILRRLFWGAFLLFVLKNPTAIKLEGGGGKALMPPPLRK